MTTNSNNMIVNEASNQYRIVIKDSLDSIAAKLKPITHKVDRSERNAKINYDNQCRVVKALYKLDKNISFLNTNIQMVIAQQVELENRIQNIEAITANIQTVIAQQVQLENRIQNIEAINEDVQTLTIQQVDLENRIQSLESSL